MKPVRGGECITSTLGVGYSKAKGPDAYIQRRISAPSSGSARRRARERRLAKETRVEGERLARERRERRLLEKMEHQRLARDQLASYEPWGRAGGGAPNMLGVRYTNLRAKGIYPEDELQGISQYEPCHRWPSPQHRRRRRTPLRLREDPQLLYAETLRKSVDNDIRYRQTPDQQKSYKEILDDMVTKRNKEKKDERKRNQEYERKMQTMEGPWGKPGPGGTTWRNPRNVGLNFSKSMGWTDNEIFDKIKGDHKRFKRSSLALPKVKRVDDSKGTKEDESVDKENVKPSNVQKLPDIKHTNSPANSQEESRRNSSDKKDAKEPNGTNARGKRSPKKGKFVKRLPNGERVKRSIPNEDLNAVINQNISNTGENKLTPETAILRVTGGVELVPLLARRRRVGARTLHSSDVTRPPDESCQWREIMHVDYLRDLKHQMQVKYERNQEKRRDSAESVIKHHETWASLWGRPGHGAPQRGRYARSNLAQLLYVPPLASISQNAQ